MPEQNTPPLRDYVEEHPRELWRADEVVTGSLDRLLRLVEPIVDRRDDDGPARAA
jgi:hypothetical protein